MAPLSIAGHLVARQSTPNASNDGGYFWSTDGQIIKYVVTAAVILVLLVWVFGGMWHANRRVAQGKRPLFYHRWLAPSFLRQSARAGQMAVPAYGAQREATTEQWNMNNWNYAPPPPSYSQDAPPDYQVPVKDITTTHVTDIGEPSPRPEVQDTPPSADMPRAPEQIHSPTSPTGPHS